MVLDIPRIGLDARFLVNNGTEPDMYMEISITGYGRIPHRTHAPSPLSRDESRRGNNSNRCRRRDSQVLERVPEARRRRTEEREPSRLWKAYTLILTPRMPSLSFAIICISSATTHPTMHLNPHTHTHTTPTQPIAHLTAPCIGILPLSSSDGRI